MLRLKPCLDILKYKNLGMPKKHESEFKIGIRHRSMRRL